jgi:hypothetical protein
MSKLAILKAAKTLSDVADILNFQPRALSYIDINKLTLINI